MPCWAPRNKPGTGPVKVLTLPTSISLAVTPGSWLTPPAGQARPAPSAVCDPPPRPADGTAVTAVPVLAAGPEAPRPADGTAVTAVPVLAAGPEAPRPATVRGAEPP